MRCREFFVEKAICAPTSYGAERWCRLNKRTATMLLSGLSHLGCCELSEHLGEEMVVPSGAFELAAHGVLGGLEGD